MKTAEAAELQVIEFRLGQEFYALPIADVREVRRYEPVTPMPESPAFMAGVLRLRGHVLAVMDLAQRLGKKSAEHGDKTRLLIVRLSQSWTGLIVDEVQGVITLSKKAFQALPAVSAQPPGPHYVSAIFQAEERLVLLLDAAALS
jgi:purine-binding chemotaxis protein CheW